MAISICSRESPPGEGIGGTSALLEQQQEQEGATSAEGLSIEQPVPPDGVDSLVALVQGWTQRSLLYSEAPAEVKEASDVSGFVSWIERVAGGGTNYAFCFFLKGIVDRCKLADQGGKPSELVTPGARKFSPANAQSLAKRVERAFDLVACVLYFVYYQSGSGSSDVSVRFQEGWDKMVRLEQFESQGEVLKSLKGICWDRYCALDKQAVNLQRVVAAQFLPEDLSRLVYDSSGGVPGSGLGSHFDGPLDLAHMFL